MKKLNVIYLTLVLSLTSNLNFSCLAQSWNDEKIDSLINLMTIEEKIGQLTLFTSDWATTGPTIRENYLDDIRSGKAGNIFNAHTAAYNEKLQRVAVEESRLGIPLLFGYDVIHGYKTIFPIPLAEAASWDLNLIEKSARIAAEEATAGGLHWTFAPMVDIARDPRWGRVAEGSGEDVYLGSLIAGARVRGFQGKDLSSPNTLLACAKHFAAYGAAQGGRDYNTVDISRHALWETYLPPFKSALDAGVATFMTSFNELDGVPASANTYLLKEILRGDWNFQGFVVSDYTSINEMVAHGFAENERSAAMYAFNAGLDMDMQGAVYYNYLKELVDQGRVSVNDIDTSVKRILKLKNALGLFDDPYRYSDIEREKSVILSEENRTAAREIARQSVVLLENKNNTLPLSKTEKIALIGSLADSPIDMLGSWHGSGQSTDVISTLKAFTDQKMNFEYAKGSDMEGSDTSLFREAVDKAKNADKIVLVAGEHFNMSGEAASRAHIRIPDIQIQLLKRLLALHKPIILVLINGRPLCLEWESENMAAILEAWQPGTMAGLAITDVLYGEYNPSGKLPITFPVDEGQIPVYYNMKNTGRPMDPDQKYTSKYLDIPNAPLYPFGYGLSYTSFQFSQPSVDKTEINNNDSLHFSITVSNTGSVAGHEVVQLYMRDLVGSITRPVKELKSFKKIYLEPGNSQKVSFTITPDDLKFYNSDLVKIAEPGEFLFGIGNSSDVELNLKVTLK
ncbi:MAG: glycoside hydrolase family 3 C-terminal domain-containing protein [Saprospiraceae bacterium]|nr:glycoside hydrolase family 3 C-terminal domain-containing protein [Saprospiraceae bacterium]